MAETPTVPIANTDAENAWNGAEGNSWAEEAERYNRANERFWQRLLAAANFDPAECVLDIGCGTGKSTRDVARIVDRGSAVGFDISAPMLELARSQAAADGLTNVTFIRGDAQVHQFEPASFDAAISSFGVMFFNDPVAAFTNLGGALRPGGRLALQPWGDPREQGWLLALREAFAMGRELPFPPPDGPTPFSLADPDRVRPLLESTGYQDITFEACDDPIDLGATVDDALAFARTMGIPFGFCHFAARPGDLVALDSFYIGNLKGVGPVWQLTAVDTATRWAICHVFLGPSNTDIAKRFFDLVRRKLRRLGIIISSVLTDNGPEFSAAFDAHLAPLGIAHRRTPPRSPNYNAVCERFQGTALQECWRPAFHRRRFDRIGQLRGEIDSWLVDYNTRRANLNRPGFSGGSVLPTAAAAVSRSDGSGGSRTRSG